MASLTHFIRPIATPRLYRKRENILFQGEVPHNVTLILNGIVKAYTIDSGGEERIAALYGKGDLLPIAWAVGKAPNALFYYEALNDVRTLQVSHDKFEKLTNEHDDFRSQLLELLAQDYSAMLLRVTGLVQSRAIDKICYTLLYLMFRYGIEQKPGIFVIDVRISQSSLAELIGQTRESTAKNLKILRDKNVISYESSTYTVNKPKLEQFIGEDSFLDNNFLDQV